MRTPEPHLDPSPLAEQAEYEIKSSAPEQINPRVREPNQWEEKSADALFGTIAFVALLIFIAAMTLIVRLT